MAEKTKAKIRLDINEVDGTIRCSFCGKTEKMPIGFGAYTLPQGWQYSFSGEEETARVMCDKCFNQYD